MKKLALHWKIIIGMVLGIIFGFLMNSVDGGKGFVGDWIAPFGKIFINLLKLIAVPLILASLIKGISDLKDISKIKTMGLRTIGIYIGTTVIAIIIGLSIVNIVKPGEGMPQETIDKIKTTYQGNADVMIGKAKVTQDAGPLQALVDIFPSNIFFSFSDANGKPAMLQVIFFALFVGICLLLIPVKKAKPLVDFFDSLNEVVMKMVDLIMLFAPYAVFALMANVIIAFDDTTILVKLLGYAACVVFGLFLMICFYLLLIKNIYKKITVMVSSAFQSCTVISIFYKQ